MTKDAAKLTVGAYGHSMREVYSAEEIAARVAELGREIDTAYAEIAPGELVAVCVLKGAYVFFADLLRAMRTAPRVEFVRLASYGDSTARSSEIRFVKDVETPIRDRHVLVVEDIVDTGHSMAHLMREFTARGPASLKICSLVDKFERREVDLRVDFPGFTLDEGFIVGYGMDYAERYRELPGIHAILQADA